MSLTHRSFRVVSVALALCGSSAVATGQQAPPAGTSAAAVGVVFDSLRGRPLAGATIRVDSSDQITRADQDGRFRIEGIAPGGHILHVEHPLLDTIGLSLHSPRYAFAAGATVGLELVIPGQEAFVQYVCSSAWRNRGPAVLMGRVRDADTGVPATGAKVSLVWYEIQVTNAVRRSPRVREAQVGADGTYRICGLPAQLEGKVQVLRGDQTSGEIQIDFGDDVVYLRSMGLASQVAVAGDTTRAPALGTARVTGRVVSNSGLPLPNARVQLEGTTRAATTRPNGDFVLDSLPSGTQSLSVRLLGYAPVEQAVDLVSSQSASVTIKLTEFVPVLEAVRVSAARERGLESIGFTRRRRAGQGYYMDDKDINENSTFFSDVLRTAPGIRVVPSGPNRQVITSTRGTNSCTTVWVDGTMWQSMQPGDIDDFVRPHELAAIEVYSPSTTPAEFQSQGGNCATIVAWTYRKLDRERKR
jgi:hypothetical protein